MSEPKLDIFSGTPGEHVWIEAVPGLSNAQERMAQIAERTPGRYFLFSIGSRTILGQLETFGTRESTIGD
jgi:hypothetical protein